MTCIVGFVEGNTVWMGADSAGVAGLDLTVRGDQKVFRNGSMIFGFTTSFRMGQLIRHALTIPFRDPAISIEAWMTTTFVDVVRECLKTHGWASKVNEQEQGGVFLVGYAGRLFNIRSDYQVGIPLDGFDAVGCGAQIARGALFASVHLSGRDRLTLALEAAERHSAGVRRPFVCDSLVTEASS